MSDHPEEWTFLETAWRFTWLLTGCKEGVDKVFSETVEEIRRHPHTGDADRTACLFYSILRKRALRFPARCALDGPAASLHREPEPARSAQALLGLRALSSSDVQRVLDLDAKTLVRLEKSNLSPAELEETRTLPLPAGAEEQIARAAVTLKGLGGEARHFVRNPATFAVGAGFLLLIAILVWNFLGRAGVFPDEAIKIATTGAMASPEQFEAIEEKAAALQDWFLLKGNDSFRVPPGFENFVVAGVRTFKVENEPVAQAAAMEQDRTMYFYSFAAQPFGIDITPEKSWRITEADRSVLAIRESDGICFLIAFRGTKKDMQDLLEKNGGLR
jgi:hypothetical protein